MRLLAFTTTTATALLLAGCASGTAAPATAAPPTDPMRSAHGLSLQATFDTAPDARAITYQPGLVPSGAEVSVQARTGGGATMVRLSVDGLQPDRTYGAHAHTEPCGPMGDAAGPHLQHEADPNQPSTDPAFANPQNEVWLDLATDAAGAAVVESNVGFELTEQRPGSVVIHESSTSSEPGEAGTAGARVACVTVGF